jgi:hypothetical protein
MIATHSGEILVYSDWCDECMSTHWYAHGSDGNRCNLGLADLNANPSYYQAGHKAGIIHYRVRYSAGLHIELPALEEREPIDQFQDW